MVGRFPDGSSGLEDGCRQAGGRCVAALALADHAGEPGFLHRLEAVISSGRHVLAPEIQARIVRGRDLTRYRPCASRMSGLTAILCGDIVLSNRGLRRTDMVMSVEDSHRD